jgi:hypothetical protein
VISFGDGTILLKEFVSHTGTTTEFDVPLIVKQNGVSHQSAVISIQIQWIPDEAEDDYEPPIFD